MSVKLCCFPHTEFTDSVIGGAAGIADPAAVNDSQIGLHPGNSSIQIIKHNDLSKFSVWFSTGMWPTGRDTRQSPLHRRHRPAWGRRSGSVAAWSYPLPAAFPPFRNLPPPASLGKDCIRRLASPVFPRS